MTRHMRIVASLTTVGVLACAAALIAINLAAANPHERTASTRHRVDLTASACSGPTGTAYVADPGFQGFTAINTANCQVIQTYNVDDLQVPGDSGDDNFVGSDAGIALSGTTLWFAVTGTDNVAAIDAATLTASNFNPAETLIPVGFMPDAIAATPDGSEVWVIDSGPQTTTSSLWDVEIIDTSTDTVTGRLNLVGDPTDVAFSPDGKTAYVTASNGLYIYNVASEKQIGFIAGLGSPKSVVVSPNGSAVYVTETSSDRLATINTATNKLVRTTSVGDEPWQAVVSPNGSTVYVANPDSDSITAVDATSGAVESTYTVPGDPDTLGLTPDGSQLWVAGDDSGVVTVIDTATGDQVGSTNLGGDGANSGDGFDPTGMVLTTSPPP